MQKTTRVFWTLIEEGYLSCVACANVWAQPYKGAIVLQKINSKVDPAVFWWSNFFIYLLVFMTVFFGEDLSHSIELVKVGFINSLGWSYIVLSLILAISLLWILFRYGNIKIGGESAQPDFSKTSWISMLFSAGLGTGLVYSGVFEPLAHYFNAPQLSSLSGDEKFIEAMDITFFHWGVPAWLMYSATGLMFAILSFNLNKSFQFAHFIPEKFNKVRVLVNTTAVLSILTGVITTFVLASSQMSSGLVKIMPDWLSSFLTPSFTILLVTFLATLSVLSGLKKGIRRLSELNILIALVLFVFVFLNIDQVFYFKVLFSTLAKHAVSLPQHFLYRSFINDSGWLSDWTLLYWAWWTAWLPFVGLFIARISKGRTIREYIFGTVMVPSFVTFLWFSLFGSAGYLRDKDFGLGLRAMIDSSSQEMLFAVLDTMPLASACTFLAVVCVLIFYVTSSDSGSYVVDLISSGKREKHSPYLKIYWSVLEGVLAIVLLKYGGVSVIKNLVVIVSLPVLLYLCFGILKLLKILEQLDSQEKPKN